MDRIGLQTYIEEIYGAAGEHPFGKEPATCVFRHQSNGKWFAVIMQIPKEKLGLDRGGAIAVVNFKCDPRLIGSFREEKGIYPAYHMSKAHWLTVALDGTAGDEQIRFLLNTSYDLTKRGR